MVEALDPELLGVLRDAVHCGNHEVATAILRDDIGPLSPKTAARLLLGALKSLECRDPNVRAAHTLLKSLEPELTPPLHKIRVAALEGDLYAACRNGKITIDPESPFYRDPWACAALLVHENHHRLHGGDEPGAYAAEIKFLERHHPEDQELIDEVREIAALALEEETRLTEADMHFLTSAARTPAAYADWLRKRRARLGMRTASRGDLKTGLHVHMEDTMEIPQPYDEALRKLRAANGSTDDTASEAARLREMATFRTQVLTTAASSRLAAAHPATGATYTSPPNSYDEAMKARTK